MKSACWWKLLLLLLLPVLLVGCGSKVSPSLTGLVVLGDRDLRMDDALVELTGPTTTTTVTNHNGVFYLGNLPEGIYTVKVTTLAGTVQRTVPVFRRNEMVTIRVPYPAGLDEETFFDIAGLWDLIDDGGGLVREISLTGNWRWRNGATVPVYFNTADSFPGLPQSWVTNAVNYMSNWPEVYDNKVTFYRVYSPQDRGIEIVWRPAYALGDGTVGATTVLAWDAEGYLDWVEIQVDEHYGNCYTSAVLGHEMLHAIGAGHSSDYYSILYPFVHENNQRVAPTDEELQYLKWAFAVAPKQKVVPPRLAKAGTTATKAQKAAGPRVATIVNRPGQKPEVVRGIPDFLKSDKRLQQKLEATGASSGYLWDEIGK